MKKPIIIFLLFFFSIVVSPLFAQSEDIFLIRFVHEGNIDKVRELLAKKVSLTERDHKGRTAIGRACEDGSTEILAMLLEAGADPNLMTDRKTPLMLAAYANKVEVVQLLLEKGARIDEINKMRETALMKSSAGEAVDVVRLLLERGADVNAKRIDGWSALTFAVWLKNREIAQMLIDKNADIHARCADGRSLLAIAKENNDKEMIELLKKHHASD